MGGGGPTRLDEAAKRGAGSEADASTPLAAAAAVEEDWPAVVVVVADCWALG